MAVHKIITYNAAGMNDESFSSGTWSISNVSVSVANDALAALFYVPATNYDVDAAAAITIEDADGLSISNTITLDVVPVNETPSVTEMDQTESKFVCTIKMASADMEIQIGKKGKGK